MDFTVKFFQLRQTMAYGNEYTAVVWHEWFAVQVNDSIQMKYEKILIRIVVNTQSGSNTFQDLLRFFNQYSDNPKRQQSHISVTDQTP